MLVPSFAVGAGPEDLNLVIWKWGFQRPYRVILIDNERRVSRGSR